MSKSKWKSGERLSRILTERRTVMRHLVSIFALIGVLSGPGFAALVEDFEDVSDWGVYKGASANSGGSIGNDDSDKPEPTTGMYGVFHYELSDAMGGDVYKYTKTLASAVDLTDMTIDFYFKQANDPYRYLQLRLIDSVGGKRTRDLAEAAFPDTVGQWDHLSIPISDFYGTGDITDIVSFQFIANGDAGDVATSNTFYVDQLEYVPEPASATILLLGALAMFRRRKR